MFFLRFYKIVNIIIITKPKSDITNTLIVDETGRQKYTTKVVHIDGVLKRIRFN
jgi:hypothetical protein